MIPVNAVLSVLESNLTCALVREKQEVFIQQKSKIIYTFKQKKNKEDTRGVHESSS